MTTQPIKLGLLSFAHGHANSYAACLQTLLNVSVVGVYDDDAARLQKTATRFNFPSYTNAQALLDQQLDGVIICAENANHRPLVELAAGQVQAILCEKPIATTLSDAQAMIDICAETGTKLQIAYPVRFMPPIQEVKKLLDQDALGRVFSAKCTNHGSMPGGWFTDLALAGGGAVMDHTVHVIDLLRWFWGTEVTEIYAEIGTNLIYPDLNIDDGRGINDGRGIDDAGMLSFTLANGIFGTLDTSWSRQPSYPTWGDVTIDLVGEKGRITVDAFRQHLAVSSNRTGKTSWVGWGSNGDQGLINDFVEMLRQGRDPFISGRDGLQGLAVTLAAYESARTGRPVRLDS